MNNAYDLLEALQAYVEECEEKGIEPQLAAITQPNHPIYGPVLGSAVVDGKFFLGAQMTGGYGTEQMTAAFDGFDYENQDS